MALGDFKYDNFHNRDALETAVRRSEITYKCLIIWNGLMVLFACLHLSFFLWQIRDVTKRINKKYLHAETKTKAKINVTASACHIVAIIGVSLIFLTDVISIDQNGNEIFEDKILTTSVFIIALQDVFVICMLWSVMDSTNKPLF